jgi:hypothetical protein
MNITGVCKTSLVAGIFATALIAAGAAGQGADECSGATALANGTPAPFNTATATASALAVTDELCAGTYLNWLDTQKDVWFKFTANEAGLLEVNTCLSGSYDTSVVIYSGNCASLTAIACNGDGTGLAGCQTYYSRVVDVAVNSGETVYIRIGGYNGEVGSGQVIALFSTVPPGCLGAVGPCNEAHGGLGCQDANCCALVCAFNPGCCDIGWDPSCVITAIEQCGFYYCPPQTGAPANNCATAATLLPGNVDSNVNFNTTNASTDGPDHPGATCQSGSDLFAHDVWYQIAPARNGSLKVSTCGSVTYDNKLAVYNLGADPDTFDYNELAPALVGCNDDGVDCNTTSNPPTAYASELTVNVVVGNTYLIRLGSYAEGDVGSGVMRVTVPVECVLGAGSAEGEDCGAESNDGCNAGGGFGNIAIGQTVRGNFWADANTRDTDFYQFQVTAPTQVTLAVKSASLATVLLIKGDLTVADCAGVQIVATGAGTCPTSCSSCLAPGIYYAFAAINGFSGAPCGSGSTNEYSLELSGTPATCPITLSGGYDGTTTQQGVCANPGPTTVTTSTAAPGGGLVACAAAPAFPNCSGGGTTANSYARSIPAGQLNGEISCIDVGVFCVVRDQNAAGTGCVSYISDIPLPAKLGLYADLDGGAPRKKTADGGADGGDLDPIFVQDVLVSGGAYKATLNLEAPVCVQDYATNNLVVIMDCPDFVNAAQPGVPQASGYGLRAGGGAVTGQGSNTYVRLSCADGAGQFVLAESLGATFTAQWIVNVNGTNGANCSVPPCPGDFNNDGVRNGTDLTVILSGWGSAAGDVNGDGTTNGTDLTILLSGWGACPTG